jgi:hypothetical protein
VSSRVAPSLRGVALVQRQLALAAVALLGAVGALAVAAERDTGSSGPALPRAVPAPGGGWYAALAAPRAPRTGRRTACGHVLTRLSVGVAHPVLPCDIKLYIRYGGKTILTQVIDRGPYVPGREFALTPELAQLFGLRGTQPIRWRFAG